MAKTRRKKVAAPVKAAGDEVEVRVSTRAPRAATPPVTRAQNLAAGLLDALIGQVADYVEHSHAVERLIRAQTGQVLRELARDPQLKGLIRAQVEEYVAELVAHPEILEPLVQSQVERYLAREGGKDGVMAGMRDGGRESGIEGERKREIKELGDVEVTERVVGEVRKGGRKKAQRGQIKVE